MKKIEIKVFGLQEDNTRFYQNFVQMLLHKI